VILNENGISPVRLLDPSAGTGIFSESFKLMAPNCETTDFEKDFLTGKILSHLNPSDKVRIEGFESIGVRYNGYFDIAASNIPFGDIAVFDPSYRNRNEPAYNRASDAIHNYFFMKSVDCVREGGLVAFITSQGVLNSESNRPVREWLMQRSEPVSVVRFPNNLFTDTAGTEVGSDLIILQKKAQSGDFSDKQRDFIESRRLSNGIPINNLFQTFDRVIHTDVKVGTDPYGKPAMEFTHSGGELAIAAALRGMLRDDFLEHLDVELYKKHAIQVEQSAGQSANQELRQSIGYEPTEKDWQEMGEMITQAEKEQREEERDPQPENYERQITEEEYEEIDAAVKAVRQGKWDEFAAKHPYINNKPVFADENRPEETYDRKSTYELDWEENQISLEDVIGDDVPEMSIERKSTYELDREENSLGISFCSIKKAHVSRVNKNFANLPPFHY